MCFHMERNWMMKVWKLIFFVNVYASKVRCCRRTRWQLGRRETSRVAPEPPPMRSQWNQIQNGSFRITIITSLYDYVYTHHTYIIVIYSIYYQLWFYDIDSTHNMSSIISKPFHKIHICSLRSASLCFTAMGQPIFNMAAWTTSKSSATLPGTGWK